MNDRVKRGLFIAVRIVLTAALFTAAALVLNAFGYFSQWTQVDNVVGALPVAFALLFAGCGTALVWLKHVRRTAFASAVLAVVMIASAVLYPNALRGNWWFGGSGGSGGDSPDLSLYEPFKEGTLAARLEGEASLSLKGELPVMDGATALYPVYAAFAQAVYDREDYSADAVRCTNTAGAYRSIISGDADIIFVAAPSASQKKAAEDAGVELTFTPVAREAFVFIKGRSNPIDSLTVQQIRNIYTGKTAKWSTLGWKEGGDIIAFRRPEASGSESGLCNIVMKGMPVLAPQPLPDGVLDGSNSLMKQMSVWYNGVQPALGYSYRFFAQTMYPNEDTALLAVDGVAPTDENIADGSYPFVADVYAVTRGEPDGAVKQLLQWILSPQGQYLIEASGYTPV